MWRPRRILEMETSPESENWPGAHHVVLVSWVLSINHVGVRIMTNLYINCGHKSHSDAQVCLVHVHLSCSSLTKREQASLANTASQFTVHLFRKSNVKVKPEVKSELEQNVKITPHVLSIVPIDNHVRPTAPCCFSAPAERSAAPRRTRAPAVPHARA